MGWRTTAWAFCAVALPLLIGGMLALAGAAQAIATFDGSPALVLAAPIAGFLLVGFFSGWILRATRVAGGAALVLVAVLTGALLLLVHPLMSAMGTAASLPLEMSTLWFASLCALSAAAGMVTVGVRSGGPGRSLPPPTDDEVQALIREKGLMLTRDEVRMLRRRPGGLVCRFCCTDYSDQTDDWRHQWMRCGESPDHICHVWHFEEEGWRCPKCKWTMFPDRAGAKVVQTRERPRRRRRREE